MIKDRIEKIIRDDGMTSSRFADEIGVQRSSISHILSGRNNPSLELVQKILYRYRNVNPEWLLNGTGEAYKSNIKQTSIFEEEIKDVPVEVYGNINTEEIKTEERIDDTKEAVMADERDDSVKIEKIVVFYSNNTFKEFVSQ